ncbi:LysR family transcriptional regulator [Pseudomonas typographi]|uniref:LysR family transcriptional regulator n=1 Tax=Pseudomonas typographi TaxID=2715964 RepID=UPI001686C0DD|nr:LysR family transcriptional regulator [Pseudomonas typographi]MBD1552575.1 LysR family transcriptional regulator [Pseudomonas typographi]MBD1586155.1 LysR family transcriptional regulator [Pseudomonas typographi]
MATPKDISMRQLRYFVAAADAGQFSQAALKVHVSQSAITAAVLQLEEALGVSLFDRLPYGVALTAEGNKFAQHARHILDTLQDALSEPLFLSHAMQGTVRVGASYTVLGYFLPALLARFKRSYPQVEIDLVDMDRQSIETAVYQGSLDLGLALVSNTTDLQCLEHQVLIRSRRQLWLSSQHPLMAAPSITLEDVAEHPYILATVDEGETSTFRYWQSRGLQPQVAFRTSSMEALRGLVGHGFGVTILSDMLYRAWSLEGKKIDIRPLADAVPPMELGLIWKPGTDLPEPAQAFRQFLIMACAP